MKLFVDQWIEHVQSYLLYIDLSTSLYIWSEPNNEGLNTSSLKFKSCPSGLSRSSIVFYTDHDSIKYGFKFLGYKITNYFRKKFAKTEKI